MMLFTLVLLPYAAAIACAMLPNTARNATAALAGAVALGGCALLGVFAPAVFSGEVPAAAVAWFPGVSFGFRLDGLAWTFALIVYAIGALVVLYARYYLAPTDPPARFFALLLAFMGAMLGIVVADNLILLVVFWELTSLASFLLIGFWNHRADARQGARMALAVTGGGGLCLLGGVVLIGQAAGGYSLDIVLAAAPRIQGDPWFPLALVLVLLGAFTKSAQFPFHFWLPHAMAAPTPVSAYLHSATMVKAGVFLLARLYPALGGNDIWFYLVTGTGLVTLTLGAAVAIFQQDLKGLLAYSTISHLGLITLLFGLDAPLAIVAGLFHILNHAAFKASLFMSAGIIDHECGSRDMRKLNGLWQFMPVTATLAMVASAAMAGVPLLNGFLSKEMFFAQTLTLGTHPLVEVVVPLTATVAGAFAVAYSLRFIHDVFFNGQPVGLPRTPHEPPRWMRIPVEFLVLVCVAVGALPALTVGPILAVAARGTLGAATPTYNLAIWHGFNLPLLMSMIATAAGVAFYFGLQRWINLHSVTRLPVSGKHLFDRSVAAIEVAGRAVLTWSPTGSLPRALTWIVLAALAAMAWPLFTLGFGSPATGVKLVGTPPPTLAVLIWGLSVSGAIAATLCYRRRVLSVLLLGATGLAVSLGFVLLSAPDLALTQLLVEVATVALILIVLHFLPQSSPAEPSRLRLWRDAAIAGVAGVGMTVVAHAVLTRPFTSISPFFLERALTEGGGTNVVNVILVDFRGFDTLGEITVLGMAALIVHALLRELRLVRAGAAGAARAAAKPWDPWILRIIARLVLPLAALLAVFLFLRGHNLPGGGFIAGLTLACALILLRISDGGVPLDHPDRLVYPAWIGVGLVVAGLTGVGSLIVGYPFLTSVFAHPVVPLLGELPIASAALFDLGVFVTVVAATLLAALSPGLLPDGRISGSAR